MATIKKTCLEMIQTVSSRVGAAATVTIEDVSTGEHRLLLSSLNAANTNIVTGYDWSELTKEAKFSADKTAENGWNESVGGYELSKIAPGFLGFKNKLIVSTTSNVIYSFGTIDEFLNAQIMPTAYRKFIVKDGCLCFLDPQPATTEAFAFHYKTNLAVKSNLSGSVEFTNWFRGNSDTWILDDQLLIRAAVVEYKNSRGIDSTYDLQQYQSLLNALRDANASKAILGEYPSNSDWAFRMSATKDSNA
jgi:hypothetical protein